MKRKLFKPLLVGLACLSSLSCQKAKENIDILINADIIHYSVLLEVEEPSGKIPQNLSLSATGADAGLIYDIAGNKNLRLINGLITLGVNPKNEPTDGKAINLNIKITGPGYVGVTIPLIIKKGQFSQVKTIKILKLSSPPASVTIADKSIPLSIGSTPTQPIIVSSPTNAISTEKTTVTVPLNTQFLGDNGAQISGPSVDLNVINYKPQSPETADLFPGGSFKANNVNGPNNQNISAFFMPAGFATVTMTVNNIEVKKFNQPITISMELDPSYKLLSTNTTIKAGDQLSIWSYSEESGKWNYEKEGTVNIKNGKPVVEFTTNHLTVYSVAEYVETTTCNDLSLIFNASWLKTDTQPLTLEIWDKNETKLLSTKTIIVNNGLKYPLNDLPSFEVKYKILTSSSEVLASGSIISPCSADIINITVGAPLTPVIGVTLSLIIKCPDKGIITPPDFYLYYKTPGSPDINYRILGVVKKGILSTTLLTIGQRYDFKAQWGGREKIIKNYLIDKDNLSTTVGLDDHIGDISPAKNRAILIEECDKI